jgi:CHAT domain-containing protein
LRLRYTKTGAPEELEHAISAHREAAKIGLDQNPERTLVSARNWLLWAIDRKNWLESSEAYDYAALATEKLYHAQLVRSGKEIWLTKTQGIAACGAYALAQIGKPEEAVVAIERDRARMLSEVLGRDRVGLEELKSQGHADLHARYIQAVDRLSHLAQASSATGEHVSANAAVTDALREAQSELEAAIGAIRQAPGFEGFVHLPNFEDVRAAACDSQLVYVLAGKVGGLALIIPQGGLGPIAAVALPNLTEQTLLEQLQGVPQPASHTYLMAYAAWRNDPLHDETLALRWLNALEATTRWLWDTVMGPIIEAVSPIETVTLVPCGWLGLLPLHAAWTEDPAKPTGRCYALDRVRLRYAPNARALLAAIATSQHDLCGSLLVVEEPQPVSGIPLPNATYEVEMAAASFPQVTTLAREQAKRDKVLQLMRTCSVVHFACHGSADFDEPLKSQLLMANDEALSVRQMLEIRLENARLAVLSACEAGIPGPKLPDEVVGLPAGLFQAGFPGVIAPIWSVADLSTAMLMVRFYAYWRGERLEPIEALRQAQRWLRDTTNEKKVGYFESFLKPSAQDLLTAARIPPRVAGAVTEELRLRSPEKRDFKHPYFWAGFSYTGV